MNLVINKKIKGEFWLYALIGCVWIKPFLMQTYSIFRRLPVLNFFANGIEYWIIGFVALMSFSALRKRIEISDFLFYIGFVIVYLLQFIIYPENSAYLSEFLNEVLFFAVPFYFVGRIWESDRYTNMMFHLSIFMIAFMLFMQVYYIPRFVLERSEESHEMTAAYGLLPHLIFLTYQTDKRRNLFRVIMSMIGILFLLSLGNRGSIVCYIFFCIIFFIFIKREKPHFLLGFLLVVLLLLFNNFFTPIALILNDIISSFGMSTRIISMFLTNELGYSEDRDQLINTLMQQLNNGEQESYGLFGTWNYIGYYSHRIFVDFWFSFGYILGSLLLALLALIYYRAYKKCHSESQKTFLLFFISIGLLPLLFSFNFLVYDYFYILLGYSITLIKNRNN